MAGEAITTNFMLGSATVMLGPLASLMDLTPELHSIGLVKNVAVTNTPGFTELTQGVKNQLVYSVKTQNDTTVKFEAYEYTGRNMAHALGLATGNIAVAAPVATTLSGATTASATTISVTSATGITTGKWLVIELSTDRIYVRQVASVASLVVTLTQALPAVVIPTAAVVRVVDTLDIGSSAAQEYASCKIVGVTAEGKAVGFLFPKVQVSNGFNLAFTTDNFGNMPFELKVFDLTSTDVFYSTFGQRQGVMFHNN